ncbi:hypothetical protein INT43_007722 [Umbelopsis isabellina]|uniref:Cytochrome b-c1 complex subunit 2, mitochondrial n=1 Tax=Mortierella isabellina TaxID=91625 RepID=A0A8H7U999_MORIS|nr:hypothetical protein INT43_007722 [Umbelopsis isabellina]
MLYALRSFSRCRPFLHHHQLLSVRSITISQTAAGVTVATFPEPGLTAGLSVIVGGGSRYETDKTAGAAHYLKNYTFMNNKKRRALRIAREAELESAVLSRTLGYEYMSIQAQFLKGDEDYFTEILSDVVCRQKYDPFEFAHVQKLVGLESNYARASPRITGLEKAHMLAFRNGLGNPLFSGPLKINQSMVEAFSKEVYRPSNIVLIGRGVDHKKLLGYVHLNFDLEDTRKNEVMSVYYGGDERLLRDSDLGHCTIAFQGFPIGTHDYCAASVLREYLDSNSNIKWSLGGSLLQAIQQKLSLESQITCFNLGYSDNGLFGVQIDALNSEMSRTLNLYKESILSLNCDISDHDLYRAKNLAKMKCTNAIHNRLDFMDYMGYRILNGHNEDVQDILRDIDTIDQKDIQRVVSKIFSSKPSMVTIGKLQALPYIDQYVANIRRN